MNTALEKALENLKIEYCSQDTFTKLISNGCIEKVRSTIDKFKAGVIFQTDKNGFSLLHLAVKANQIDIVLLLLERGAEINARCKRGTTPLHVAVDFNNVEIINILAKNGANIDAKSKSWQTPLLLAVNKGQTNVAKLLIEHGASIEFKNAFEETPLHIAIRFNQVYMAKILIESGADVQAQDYYGFTALGAILRYQRWEILEMVILNGVNINAPLSPNAYFNGNLLINEIVELLDSKVELDYFYLIKIIIQDKISLLSKNNQGETPLEFSLKNHKMKAAKQMMFRNSQF